MTMRALTDSPRWLLLATLVYAPWAYGCTRDWAVSILNLLGAIVVVLWLCESIARRRRPKVPRFPLALVLVLLVLGWGMTLNAHSFFDADYHQFAPRAPFWPGAPGSVAGAVSFEAMSRYSSLLGLFLFTCDLCARPVWRSRLWTCMALTGLSITLFGIAQKIAQEPFLIWELPGRATTYFATYRYHANAGAFLNLVWPLLAAKVLTAFRHSRSSGPRGGLWLGAALIAFSAAFINASKAAMAIALSLALLMAGWFLCRRSWRGREGLASQPPVMIGVAALAAVGLAAVIAMQIPWNRWDQFVQRDLHGGNERLLTAKVSLKMSAEAGFFGFGPGTWAVRFPFHTGDLGNRVAGVWHFAHQDYLQTLVEWGFIGAGLWAVLFGGGMIQCFRQARRRAGSDGTLLFAAGTGLAGIAIHALVDFPLQIASLQLYAVMLLALGWSSAGWRER